MACQKRGRVPVLGVRISAVLYNKKIPSIFITQECLSSEERTASAVTVCLNGSVTVCVDWLPAGMF